MTTASKRKGSLYEREVAKYLVEQGFLDADRAFGAGRFLDRGDIKGIPGVCLELKNCKTLAFGPWLEEVSAEQANAHARYGIVVAKRRLKPVSESFAVCTLETMTRLLKEAT